MIRRPEPLTRYAYLIGAEASEHVGVFPATLSVVGRSSEEAEVSLDDWWSPEFRCGLYKALDPILSPGPKTSPEAWGPADLLQVSGLGLVNPSREHLWFGLHLIDRARHGDGGVDLLIDDRAGLRYAEAMQIVADLIPEMEFNLRWLRAVGGEIREFRLPLSSVESVFTTLSTSLQRIRSRRSGRRGGSVNGVSAGVTFFETTDKGWRSSEPLAVGILERGVDVLLATPWSRELRTHDGSSRQLRPSADFRISVTRTSVERELIEALSQAESSIVSGEAARRFVAKFLTRRAMLYLPAVEGAIASARLAVGELGAAVTMQEGHASPAARAFLLESQRLGAQTFTTHHGMVDDSAPERDYLVSPDVSLEWGAFQAPFRLASTRFVQVGSPLLEARLDRLLDSRREHVPSGNVLVAFGRPGRIVAPEFFASTIRMVAAASERLDEFTFDVTIHPGDRRAFWDVVLRSYEGEHRLILSKGSFERLLASADVLITTHSTAGAEAILCDVPVLSIGTHVDPVDGAVHKAAFTPPYVAEGAATMIDSVRGLVDNLQSLIDVGPNEETREAMKRFGERFLSRRAAESSLERSVIALMESIQADERS